MAEFVKELHEEIGSKELGPPTAEEERALIERVQAGDPRAEDELVRRNRRLVYDVARRYQTPGATFEDLVQEGTIGMLKAARKFDLARNLRFSTFAHWWIRQAISRFVKGPTRIIRLPEYLQDRIARTYRARDDLAMDLGRDPEDREVAEAVGIAEEDVGNLLRLSRDASSLETPVSGSDGIRMGSTLVDETRRSTEEEVDYQNARKALVKGLGRLPPRETRILAYRFGLADGKARSRPWIGRKMSLSAERVRQLERKALQRLREGMGDDFELAA